MLVYVTAWTRAARRVVRRRVLLAHDVVATRLEGAWVRTLNHDWARPAAPSPHPDAGRTPRDQLLDGLLGPAVWPKAADALQQGADTPALAQAIMGVSQDAGHKVAQTMLRTAPGMLREHRALRRGMCRRLRATWGPGFDSFFTVYVAVEELGSNLQQIHKDLDDDLTEALIGLQARAALVLDEVHAAMTAGFPLAAWARARTLHETAIIADVLGSYGREPGTSDLAERFLAHAVVDQARDLQLAVASGIKVDASSLEQVQQAKADAVARYGKPFTRAHGWARPLFPALKDTGNVTFAELELLAASGLDRLDYRIGSHHVHSSAWTLELNRFVRGDVEYRLTGPVNLGFTEPAAVAMAAALLTSHAAVFGVDPELPDPMHLVMFTALHDLCDETYRLLADGERLVVEREERVQRRYGASAPAEEP